MSRKPATGRKAVVLLSGGLDSAVTLAIARDRGFEAHALTFLYGQRHAAEVRAARRVARRLGAAEHLVARLDPRLFRGSALTGGSEVPKDRPLGDMGRDVPSTYVPARNTVFLSCALAWAESLGAFDLFLGVNAVDYSGYPDCRPAFLQAFARTAGLATKAGSGRRRFRLHAPLLRLSKSEIVRRGLALGVDFGLTRSCYDPAPGGRGCGRCDACLLRLRGFEEAGAADPAPYAPRVIPRERLWREGRGR
ncbi:MAG: 7-cyano-7-deazaguanine synthase QueC [Planctomycetes bacterium]|nr:7-cyano-7-deazaguanine synthase QueC [Planctomycetota bacterium]